MKVKKHKRNKKGISALVITVLLVAISIGLGTLVVSWVTTFSTQQVMETKNVAAKLAPCQDISYTVYKQKLTLVGSDYKNASFFIENGNKPISGFLLKVEDESSNILFLPKDLGQIDSSFKPHQRKWIYFYCDTCNGSILSAELIPLTNDPRNPSDLVPCETSHRTYDATYFEYE